MGLPTGMQDHYPALLGGALEIRPLPGGEAGAAAGRGPRGAGARLLVVYSGVEPLLGRQQLAGRAPPPGGEPEVTGLFEGIAATAAELPAALEAGDLPRVGELMSREWSYRRRLAAGISTPVLEALCAAAAAAGAWGGKACGAGGGGCLAFLGPPKGGERSPALWKRREGGCCRRARWARRFPCSPKATQGPSWVSGS